MKNIIILLLATSPFAHSQSDYSLGYSAGFRYGCNCNDLSPKNVAYSQGTYDQGYSDGKLDGVVYANRKTSNSQNTQPYYKQPHNYNNVPLYKHDTELIERVLVDKQRKSDLRVQDIAVKVTSIFNIVERVKEKNGSLTDSQIKYIVSFNDNMKIVLNYDLTIDQNFTSIITWLNQVEIDVLKWL